MSARSARNLVEGSRPVAVVGAGYVGLPTACVLAHLGHRVVVAESDERRLQSLRRCVVPILEEGLADVMRAQVDAGRLRFVATAEEAAQGAEFVFLCVPTPQSQDGSADLTYVERAAKEISGVLQPGAVVVNKSTVPVGSALFVEKIIGRPDIAVVSNPEFLREGAAVQDSLRPERLVVGADDQSAAAAVGALFSGLNAPLIVTDAVTAELIKYASNAFLATKLSFVNAMAGLCEAVGADVRDLILGLGYDHRIGFEYLRPGPGWGGSCLPKDTRALLHIAESVGYDFPLLRGAIDVNSDQAVRVVDKIRDAVGGELRGVMVAVWGLTFKSGTDDRRSSPAIGVVGELREQGAHVRAFDPTVQSGSDALDLDGITVCDDAYEAASGARVVAVLTEWDEFRWLDFSRVAQTMETPAVVDARNLLDPAGLRMLGFDYRGIGRR